LCSLIIWSCFLLNNHHHCMCCRHRCLLNHICANYVNNDNVHQSSKVVSGDKDVHSSLGMVKEKIKDLLLNICSILQSNSCANILKCVMGCCTLTCIRASK
jgi:hypothetical protein